MINFLSKTIILFIFFTACVKENTLTDNKLIKFIKETKKIDSELWQLRIIEIDPLMRTENLKTKEECTQLKITYSLILKQNCFIFKNFYEGNSIIKNLFATFKPAEKIYFSNKCYTEDDVKKNTLEWKNSQLVRVGAKECVSFKHILLGGGCDQEIEITKESIEENYQLILKQALNDLENQEKHLAGEHFFEVMQVNHCSKKISEI